MHSIFKSNIYTHIRYLFTKLYTDYKLVQGKFMSCFYYVWNYNSITVQH